jgi:chromosome segregation ATPase
LKHLKDSESAADFFKGELQKAKS